MVLDFWVGKSFAENVVNEKSGLFCCRTVGMVVASTYHQQRSNARILSITLFKTIINEASKSLYNFNITKLLSPNQSNGRSAVQWYFPLQSKWVFSGYNIVYGQKVGITLGKVYWFKTTMATGLFELIH